MLLPQNDEMALDLLKSLQGLPMSLDILQVHVAKSVRICDVSHEICGVIVRLL